MTDASINTAATALCTCKDPAGTCTCNTSDAGCDCQPCNAGTACRCAVDCNCENCRCEGTSA